MSYHQLWFLCAMRFFIFTASPQSVCCLPHCGVWWSLRLSQPLRISLEELEVHRIQGHVSEETILCNIQVGSSERPTGVRAVRLWKLTAQLQS